VAERSEAPSSNQPSGGEEVASRDATEPASNANANTEKMDQPAVDLGLAKTAVVDGVDSQRTDTVEPVDSSAKNRQQMQAKLAAEKARAAAKTELAAEKARAAAKAEAERQLAVQNKAEEARQAAAKADALAAAKREREKAEKERAREREAARLARIEAARLKSEERQAQREAERSQRAQERADADRRRLEEREKAAAAAADKKRIQEERAARRAAERERKQSALEAQRIAAAEKAAADSARAQAAEEEKRVADARRRQAEQDERVSEASKKAAKGDSTQLACPSGMRLMKTARFPKGSIRRGKIKGEEAIALAKSGKAYCIDVYEYPGRNKRPRTNVNQVAAEGLCKRSGKRLCSDSEWQRGCRGRGGATFPYGKSFRGGVCNTETEDGDEGVLKPSGKYRRCKSASGLFDMSGNVAEWTSDSTVRGGDYAASDEDAACNAGGRRSPGTARSNIGFRCCQSF